MISGVSDDFIKSNIITSDQIISELNKFEDYLNTKINIGKMWVRESVS